jgi:hypothetical protein
MQISLAAIGLSVGAIKSKAKENFPSLPCFCLHILQNNYLNNICVFSSLHIATHYFHDAELALH